MVFFSRSILFLQDGRSWRDPTFKALVFTDYSQNRLGLCLILTLIESGVQFWLGVAANPATPLFHYYLLCPQAWQEPQQRTQAAPHQSLRLWDAVLSGVSLRRAQQYLRTATCPIRPAPLPPWKDTQTIFAPAPHNMATAELAVPRTVTSTNCVLLLCRIKNDTGFSTLSIFQGPHQKLV